MKETLAIVVTYNRLTLLKDNIKALSKVDEHPDILVINNHSNDGTEEFLVNSNIEHITLEQNTGGAGGFYSGIREAVIRGYRYAWIMDDDTIPHSDSLTELLEASILVKDKFGFLCSYVEWVDGNACIMNKPELLPADNQIEDEYAKKGIIRCKRASFVSMLIKTEVIQKVGLPIKEFFIWGDDVEYSNRLAKFEKSYLVSSSCVLHKMKNNFPTSIITDAPDRLERYKYLYRNQTYMARKNGTKASLVNTGYIFYQIIKILGSKTDQKRKRVQIVFSGWNKGKHFNPSIDYVK